MFFFFFVILIIVQKNKKFQLFPPKFQKCQLDSIYNQKPTSNFLSKHFFLPKKSYSDININKKTRTIIKINTLFNSIRILNIKITNSFHYTFLRSLLL